MNTDNNTPYSERRYIAFFGRCNSGKSSLVNAVAGQTVSIVSAVAGTTTDPVMKAMELPGVGASVLVDTAGFDDETALGRERTVSTRRILDRTDVAVLLFGTGDVSVEAEWYAELRRRDIPVVCVLSKCDMLDEIVPVQDGIAARIGVRPVAVSAVDGIGVGALMEAVASCCRDDERLLTEGLCSPGDTVLLVMPQDDSAPRGRLIKPQVQVLRELLDRGCNAVCCTPQGMPSALASLKSSPELVITDSQAFATVNSLTPEGSRLTSFSILFARYKGDISLFVRGAEAIGSLTGTSRVLIAEACTHAPQHEDIGRVKLPRMLRRCVGEGLHIDVTGGNDFPDDLSGYDLVIHCGACMFNRRHVMSRVARAQSQGVPVTNYGVAIAALTGILDKVVY